MKECYMCSSEAISQEHIPPICIFPESKDLPSGIDYRKNLITVPSCAEHNLQKSGDDEYLLFLLVNNFDANPSGLRQLVTKIKRSISYRPAKIGIFRNPRPISSQGVRTTFFEINIDRVIREIDKISRGIYYYHFQQHWHHKIDVVLPAAIAFGSTEAEEHNEVVRKAATLAQKLLEKEIKLGANPDIFFYQYRVIEDLPRYILRMVFYGGIEVMTLSRLEEKFSSTAA